MTEEQKAAYVIAMSACAIAEIAALHFDNQINSDHGFPSRHGADDFRAVIDRYGINHKAIMKLFHGG